MVSPTFVSACRGRSCRSKYFGSLPSHTNEPKYPLRVSDAEVFAECGMYFFGSSLAKNFFRGKFTHPTQVKGLRDLLIIWSKVENVLKNIEWYFCKWA